MGLDQQQQLDPVVIIFYGSDQDIKDTCALDGSTMATKPRVVQVSADDHSRLILWSGVWVFSPFYEISWIVLCVWYKA